MQASAKEKRDPPWARVPGRVKELVTSANRFRIRSEFPTLYWEQITYGKENTMPISALPFRTISALQRQAATMPPTTTAAPQNGPQDSVSLGQGQAAELDAAEARA